MKTTIVLLVLAVCIGFIEPAFCQEIKNRWAVGLGASFVQPEDAEYEEKSTYIGKATLSYGVNNNLALELEGDTFELESETGSKVRVNTLFMNTELRIKCGKFYPYALFGAGWSFFSFRNLTPQEKKDKSNSYAYKFGGGLEYFLTKNWAINYEAAHFYTDTGKTNLAVYNWQHSIGIKYYF